MHTAVEEMRERLSTLVEPLPIGTNLGVFQVMWAMVSGRFLESRGAVCPALLSLGLDESQVRRAWAALATGAWSSAELSRRWAELVKHAGVWQPITVAGYRVVAVDLTAYWRPTLQGYPFKHYHSGAGTALPAVPLGLVVEVGYARTQRVSLLRTLRRPTPTQTREAEFRAALVQHVARTLAADECGVFDAGFPVRELQTAGVARFVARAAKNATFRRNTLPTASGPGRPREYGDLVRPLARTRRGKTLSATPPDEVVTWHATDGTRIRAACWSGLVRTDVKADPDNPTLTVVVIYDPRYTQPWVLVCSQPLTAHEIYRLYRARWPVEQVPLCAKQLLGLHRQFVFAPECRYRLPELSLLAATILTYQAAVGPAAPTGFWDRRPRPTPGRLRRVLARAPFSEVADALPARLRKKAAVHHHLLKGRAAHQRQSQPQRV
jgi:hypothetical protein